MNPEYEHTDRNTHAFMHVVSFWFLSDCMYDLPESEWEWWSAYVAAV